MLFRSDSKVAERPPRKAVSYHMSRQATSAPPLLAKAINPRFPSLNPCSYDRMGHTMDGSLVAAGGGHSRPQVYPHANVWHPITICRRILTVAHFTVTKGLKT